MGCPARVSFSNYAWKVHYLLAHGVPNPQAEVHHEVAVFHGVRIADNLPERERSFADSHGRKRIGLR
jgi:hypothetical protein